MNSLTIDLIIRVKNGYQAQREIINADYSKANESILNILKTEGFIKDYHVEGDAKKSISIELLYINKEPAFSDVRIFSKPGRRMYRSVKQLRPVLGGFGIAIISTPKGLMSSSSAKKENLGGEILFELW
jgi:small subunit ribosomal protein S8